MFQGIMSRGLEQRTDRILVSVIRSVRVNDILIIVIDFLAASVHHYSFSKAVIGYAIARRAEVENLFIQLMTNNIGTSNLGEA